MIEVVSLSFAFVFGLLVRRVGLPPLVGFLIAGFALNRYGAQLGLPPNAGAVLEHVSHLGVLLLLFTVGLKLKLKQLIEPAVLGTALLHFSVTVLLLALGIHLIGGLAAEQTLLLAIALSFSSTVLAAKTLEAKRELRAFHGRIAIGILIIQDLIALAVLAFGADHSPNAYALLLVFLPLLRPVLHWLMDVAGHEELLVLMGVVLAVGAGGYGFELMGVSPELGALAMGFLLSGHPRAQELSGSLWGLKEILLIGFFLQIGMSGFPDYEALVLALIMGAVLPLKGFLFFLLLTRFRLRARNAFLGALSLSCYSEFGLIVAANVLPGWLAPLAVTVATSFVIAAPLNRMAHGLYDRFETRLLPFERRTPHPDEQPVSLGDAEILVIGVGRTGISAMKALKERGRKVVAVDADPDKVRRLKAKGFNVVYADAEDVGFWHGVSIGNLRAAILTMPHLEGKLMAARQLRHLGFEGSIIANTFHTDEVEPLQRAGVNETYQAMASAGIGVADKTMEAV
ncbi:cation:proton antiporter [Halomonadaceae bacterium KBTZ08]